MLIHFAIGSGATAHRTLTPAMCRYSALYLRRNLDFLECLPIRAEIGGDCKLALAMSDN